jgi:hypothetical protein
MVGASFLGFALEAVDIDGDLALGLHDDAQDQVLLVGGVNDIRGLA